MSWRLKLALARGGFLFFLWLIYSSYLAAEAEKATLVVDGTAITSFGRKVCTEAKKKIQVHFAFGATTDFYYLIRNVGKTIDPTKPGSTGHCDEDIKSGKVSESFSASDPTIEAVNFVPKSACDATGSSGNQVLCIYNDVETGGKYKLVAQAFYSFNTTVAKFIDYEDVMAFNNMVSFRVKYTGGSVVKIETCHVETNKVADQAAFDKDDDCTAPAVKKVFSPPDVSIEGLTNKQSYFFKARLIDGNDGPGKWQYSFSETPIVVFGPMKAYDGSGGEMSFSCQQSGPSSLLVLAVALLGLVLLKLRAGFIYLFVIASSLFKRARRSSSHKFGWSHRLSLLRYCPTISTRNVQFIKYIFLIFLLLPNLAHADLGQMNFGILGAMYRPDLDSEINSAGNKIFPFYKCFFRRDLTDQEGPINPLMGVEMDWHLWDGFGSLQLGLGASYTFARGRALKENAAGQLDCNNRHDKIKVSLHMYQLRPQLTYIFNPYVNYFPIVPYVRTGLIGHGYMFFLGNKSDAGATKPHGFRFGYQAALGLMLMLDFFEPSAVTAARGQNMFQHVYLKGELSYTKIDSFGKKGFQFSAKDVMGSSWPLMWTFGIVFEI